MTDFEYIKEIIKDELHKREPLAQAIMLYLSKSNPRADSEIMDLFDKYVDNTIRNIINERRLLDEDLEVL